MTVRTLFTQKINKIRFASVFARCKHRPKNAPEKTRYWYGIIPSVFGNRYRLLLFCNPCYRIHSYSYFKVIMPSQICRMDFPLAGVHAE